MVTRTSRVVRYSSRRDGSIQINVREVARIVFLLLGLLCCILILGGCNFFGSNFFPMYLGFTDASFNVRELVRETYPNARGFNIRQAKFGRYIVDNVDYSKVIVFVEVFEQGRLLLFLDPVSLRPVKVVDEVEMQSWESLPFPIVINDPRINVTHRGFVIGQGLFNPISIHDTPASVHTPSPGFVLAHTFQRTSSVSVNDRTLWIHRLSFHITIYDDVTDVPLTSIAISLDPVSSPGLLLDGYFSSDGLRLHLLIDQQENGVWYYSIPDYTTITTGDNILGLSDRITRLSIDYIDFGSSQNQPIWLVKDMIVDTSRNNSNKGYQLTAIRTNNTPAGSITISTRDWSRYEVFDIDNGDQDRSRWWLLYDRNTGLLYKNRVWWSQ